MNQNVFAYTEIEYRNYPAYLSLNKRDGKYWLTVRTKDASWGSEIEIPTQELLKLQASILGSVINFGDD